MPVRSPTKEPEMQGVKQRASLARWLLALAAVLALVLGLRATGLWPSSDRSVERTGRFGRVENGSAYDKAVIQLGRAETLVLPEDAVIRRTGEPGQVMAFMQKTLAFAGHPPRSMGIHDARRDMGLAVRAAGDSLVVATYGEWDSRIEGRARLKLVVLVPEGLHVEQRAGLSGADSEAGDWRGLGAPPQPSGGGYWYAPTVPAPGWTAQPAVPDPDRTAK
jgi:hypothetical protein